jgi:S-adenosyl-L-methionine hydrolase (adenosine-forming)
MNDFKAAGVVTLTTDFGHKGPFAAVMKGVMLCRFPQIEVVDLAHDIPAHWPPEAGFWISRSYTYFPTGTVHVAIVDPGVGTEREIIAVQYDGHVFIAPDNGLLDPVIILDEHPTVYRVQVEKLQRIQVSDPSPTFHGRDIFAPLAAEIAAGRIVASDVGERTNQWTPGWVSEAESSDGSVTGIVITVDAFGNLITNIDATLLDGMSNPVTHIAGHDLSLKTTYGRAQPGEFLALINSFGVLEIARAEGSAADGLGTERGAPVTVSEKI